MNFNFIKYLTLISVTAILLSSCQRDNILEIEEEIIIDPKSELVEGEIIGSVVDVANMPMSDVNVLFNGVQMLTDMSGSFSYNDGVHELSSAVSAEKNGFFGGFRTLNASSGETTFTTIALVRKDNMERLDPVSSNRYTFDNAYVDLPGGTYTDSDNTPLMSEAMISGFWIAPTSNNLSQYPGNMNGVDRSGTLVNIANYGVLLIELTDDQATHFDLPDGATADVSFPIHPTLTSIAPSEIPMWYFDKDQSAWVEEGTATMTNGSYEGSISRLTYWRCGTPHHDILLKGNINGHSDLLDFQVYVDIERIGFSAALDVSESGNFSINIPSGETFEVTVSSADCELELYKSAHGPYAMDDNLSITINNQLGEKTIYGQVLDCNGETVDDGYVRYAYNNINRLIPLIDGQFAIVEQSCSDFKVDLIAINVGDNTISELVSDDLFDLNDQSITSCSQLEVTRHIEYENFRLADINDDVLYEWEVSNVSGVVDRVIIKSSIKDALTNDLLIEATFVANEGDLTARYEISYIADGFSIAGNCDFENLGHQGFNSFRFSGSTDQLSIIDNSLFPLSGVGVVDFDLTYFD